MSLNIENILKLFSHKFWDIVALAKADPKGFTQLLSQMDQAELGRLYWTYEQAIAELEREDILAQAGPDMTEDSFRAICEWLVGQGQDRYEAIMRKSEHLAENPGRGWFILDEVILEYRKRFQSVIPYPDDGNFFLK